MWIDKKKGYKSTASEPELIDGNGIGVYAHGTANSMYNTDWICQEGSEEGQETGI